jgi:hypothetical protein
MGLWIWFEENGRRWNGWLENLMVYILPNYKLIAAFMRVLLTFFINWPSLNQHHDRVFVKAQKFNTYILYNGLPDIFLGRLNHILHLEECFATKV